MEIMHRYDVAALAHLKGKALILAVDAGLVQPQGEGYNITPFLKFWDRFEPLLKEERQQRLEKTLEMLEHKRGESAAGSTQQHQEYSEK